MTMKKIALVAAMTAGLTQSVMAKEVVVGGAISSFADKWLTYVLDSMSEVDKANDDMKIVFADANNDSAKMIANVENFIDQGVDVVVLHPIDRQTVKPIAKKLKKAGIPLVIVNRRPFDKDMDLVASYVGSKEVEAGRIQGEFVAKTLGDKEGRVGILMGPLGLDAQINRTGGNKEVFDKYDNINVVIEQEGKWERDRGLQITEDWLQSDKKPNVITANNDEMAIGALLAANKAGLKDEDLIIVGIDATPDALEYLGKGLDATVYQDAKGQGKASIEAAYKIAKGEKVAHDINIPFQLVTVDNKADFMPKADKKEEAKKEAPKKEEAKKAE